jgi:hypothetical protein
VFWWITFKDLRPEIRTPKYTKLTIGLLMKDMRDGNDFAGWWFGDELGGSQVWARCSSHGNVPPPAGWKIPWDAPKAEPGLLTVNLGAPCGSIVKAGLVNAF